MSRRLPRPAALILLALLPLTAAAQIPRTDVLECELPGDRRFILKAEYTWYPWAHLTRSGNPRQGGTSFAAYFELPDGHSLSKAPTAIYHRQSQGGRHYACAEVGFIHGYPVVKKSFLMPNGKWFDLRLLPDKLYVRVPTDASPIGQELRARDLVPALNFAFVVPIGDRLVFEWPLRGEKAFITAVFKSESRDGGQSWSTPEITTAAEIYELGKYQEQQSFVGRPLRYNGDPVEPWTPK